MASGILSLYLTSVNARNMMTERLLQYIWQFKYFNLGDLKTYEGEDIQLLFQGRFNTNQGPDFLDARIRIGQTTWVGNIELHLRTSDWAKHKHDDDINYRNVILHVVWQHDLPDHHVSPVLVLNDRIPGILLNRYETMMNNPGFIACEKTIGSMPGLLMGKWKERLLAERMIRKSGEITEALKQSRFHWEEICWWWLARTMGMKVNADTFEMVARSLPLTLLARHRSQIHQLEALLLGQAGLLGARFTEDYPRMLFSEYSFLQKKYNLRPVHIKPHLLRMRPGNFPTVRLAQLAMLIHTGAHLFDRIRNAENLAELKKIFDITANDYWHYHYRFDELTSCKPKRLGDFMVDNIILNAVAPLLFAYGHYLGQENYKEKVIAWLSAIAGENNTITKKFAGLGISNISAFDSQSLLELKTKYCDEKKCLDCAIGARILKKTE